VLGGLQFWKNTASLIERSDLPLRTGEVFYMQLGAALVLACRPDSPACSRCSR